MVCKTDLAYHPVVRDFCKEDISKGAVALKLASFLLIIVGLWLINF